MGDCASRPSQREIDEHAYGTNTINNHCFISLPYIEEERETNLIVLENKQKYYYKKEAEYLRDMPKSDYPSIPELNVEIQKAVNLENASTCINRGRPYVMVNLEPDGPKFETFVGDSFKPYWYRLFKIQQNFFHYTHLSCTLMLKKPLGFTTKVGSVFFPIKDLQDQMIREGWYSTSSEIDSPKIRLRIQLIHNQKSLLEKLASLCRERIFAINKLIEEAEPEL